MESIRKWIAVDNAGQRGLDHCIEECAGRVNTRYETVSVGPMVSPTVLGHHRSSRHKGPVQHPGTRGAECVAVCLLAFSPNTVHWDEQARPARSGPARLDLGELPRLAMLAPPSAG